MANFKSSFAKPIKNAHSDEYDMMHSLYSLILRLNLVEFPDTWEKDQELMDEVDDYVQRCRIYE